MFHFLTDADMYTERPQAFPVKPTRAILFTERTLAFQTALVRVIRYMERTRAFQAVAIRFTERIRGTPGSGEYTATYMVEVNEALGYLTVTARG